MTQSSRPRAIITDIEGTTSSISFVKDVLFPYARRELPGFVHVHGSEPDVRRWLDAAAVDAGSVCTDDTLIEVLQGWIDSDRKHTALKALQGMIWAAGYRDGAYTAHIYADAAEALHRWHHQGHALYVYSSGSVSAQELLFGHTTAGDLTPLLSGYFDTVIGGKREVASYQHILQAIGRPADEALFLSDVVEELDAARTVGLDTVLIDRAQDYPQPRTAHAANGHLQVTSFAMIEP